MKKAIYTLLFTITVLIPVFAQDAESQAGLPVHVEPAAIRSMDEVITGFGEVKPYQDVQLTAQFGGRITEFTINIGDLISTNQLVASVRRKEAEILLGNSGEDNNDIKVTSPVSGVCIEKYNSVGDVITAGQPIARIVSTGSSYLAIRIPAEYSDEATVGDTVVFSVGSKELKYSLKTVVPVIDSATGTILCISDLNNSGIAVGTYLQVKILTKTESVVSVRRSALLHVDGEPTIFVVENNKAIKRVVKTGIRTDSYIEIKDGIAVGENVVIIGNYELSDGINVEVVK